MRLKSLLAQSDQLVSQNEIDLAIKLGPKIIREYYRQVEGRSLDIELHPTFSAKIHQRMIDFHIKSSEMATAFADKLAVKEYVSNTIGDKFIPEVIWQTERLTYPGYIEMPKHGILKCNDGCGKNVTMQSNLEYSFLKEETDNWLDNSYYWFRREYQYFNIPRVIFVEEAINDGHPDGPIDYIFYCFDGEVQLIQTGSRSHTIHSFFTKKLEKLNITYRERYEAPSFPRPTRLDQMIEIAQALSKGIDFVRVDLYQTADRVLFGEMTLTPRAGNIQFTPADWNMKLGKLWSYRYQL